MRRLLMIGLGLGLLGCPLQIHSEPAPEADLPAIQLPTDEISEARQAEIEREVLRFLRTLHRHWGTSQDTLRHALPDKLERDEHGKLIYSRPLTGHGVVEGYEFEDGSLVHGLCLFLQQPAHETNEFLEYYGTVKSTLISAYGVPAEDAMIWENDLYEPLPDYWGVAVQMGHLRFAASWETPEGTLSIELTGHHQSRLTIDYRYRQAGRLT